MNNVKHNNYAFIDGQNLYMGTTCSEVNPWKVDLKRFRVYLQEKYNVSRAYYYLGFVQEENDNIYASIEEAGFILMFREHNSAMLGTKKGNVYTEIIFDIMKKIIL